MVLDLRYEAREVEQDVFQQERIDAWFEAKTRGLTSVAKAKEQLEDSLEALRALCEPVALPEIWWITVIIFAAQIRRFLNQ